MTRAIMKPSASFRPVSAPVSRVRPGISELQQGTDRMVIERMRAIPIDQIPAVLTFLAARLISEGRGGPDVEQTTAESGKLLTAGEIAGRLSLPESWIRAEERAGRIPGVRAGKYVRFKLTVFEGGLAYRSRKEG